MSWIGLSIVGYSVTWAPDKKINRISQVGPSNFNSIQSFLPPYFGLRVTTDWLRELVRGSGIFLRNDAETCKNYL